MNGNLFVTSVSSTPKTTNEISNVIVDGNDTIIVNGNEEMTKDNAGRSNEEKTFYSKVNDYRAGLKYPEKAMLSLDYYRKIIHALKYPKGGKSSGIDAKYHGWCKHHFKIDNTSGVDILCSLKTDRRIVTVESYYTVLNDVHEKTGHGSRDKMRHEVSQHYYWIPSTIIDLYLTCCVACQLRKSVKSHVVSTAIISLGFLTRLQMDLIDLRTRPDGEYQWILHCRDHFSKFSWAFPMKTKEARFVAEHLVSLFYQFGPCKILQSDNGKEFTASVIKDLKIVWPGLVIINGRPRHPQSQGLVERGNATLCDVLGKFMTDRNTTHWTTCLPPVVYSLNTSLARGVNMTPYEIVFGQKPRVDFEIWKSLSEQENEEDLPDTVLNQLTADIDLNLMPNDVHNADVINTQKFNISSTVLSDASSSIDLPISNTVAQLADAIHSTVAISSSQVNCSVDTHTESEETSQRFDETSTCNLGAMNSAHLPIRKRAQEVYLANANKRIKTRNLHIEELWSSCSVGDYVGIKIDKVDRTNTDPKILPSVVLEKRDDKKIKVACLFGVINQWWSLESVVKLSAVSEQLVQMDKTELKEISIITASKLFVHDAINGSTCSCKGACKTKQCACKKNNVFCSTKCHKNGSSCENQGP
ncbi:unnamed protein product [Rotaria sp. Silwood2]|nr:unnamed protein product [Rotaria sp. Silwood2]